MLSDFQTFSIHCPGSCDFAISPSGLLYSIGQDDMIYQRNLKTSSEKREYLELKQGSFVTIAAHPEDSNSCIIAGASKTIEMVTDMNKQEISLLYVLNAKIEQITLVKSGKFMGVAYDDGTPAIYDISTMNVVKCRPAHGELVLSVFFSHDEDYLCSTGNDGVLKVFNIQGDNYKTPSLKYEYTISRYFDKKSNPEQILRGMFNPTDTMIACPGKPYLQVIEKNGLIFQEVFRTGIRHEKDITICHWINNEVLITGGKDNKISIWNFQRENEIVKIDDLYFTRIINYQNTFFGINNTGSIFKYQKPELLSGKNFDMIKAIQIPDSDHQSEQAKSKDPFKTFDFQAELKLKQQQNRKVAASLSFADRIVTCYPQQPLTSITDFQAGSNSRFLFYNTIGCVVETKNGLNTEIQIQYHDVKVMTRHRFPFKDREMLFFDLDTNRVVYANEKQYGFLGDFSWQYEVDQDEHDNEDIQGVALGNDWVAISLDSNILIYDLAGNYMNSFSFDKKFVAMAAYQDILALAYIDSVPVYGCQNIRMNIWNINGVSETMESVSVSVRPGSLVKAFAFSEEGMLYCQDSKEWVRVFDVAGKRWVNVFDPRRLENSTNLRYWIVGISHYQLYAFKLDDEIYQPTVLPRMYPRKIPLTVPTMSHGIFEDDQQDNEAYNKDLAVALQQLLWKRVIQDHQKFRFKTWYRYKSARESQNYNYNKSVSIKSEQELDQKDIKLDSQILQVVKNIAMKKQAERAFFAAKTFLKSEELLKKVIELFEDELPGQYSKKINDYFKEFSRLKQYDFVQNMKLKQLHDELQKGINFKPLDEKNHKKEKKMRTEEKEHPMKPKDSQFSMKSRLLASNQQSYGSISSIFANQTTSSASSFGVQDLIAKPKPFSRASISEGAVSKR